MIKIVFNTYSNGQKILQDQEFDSEEELNYYLENDTDFSMVSEEFYKNLCYEEGNNIIYEDAWLYYTESS